MIELCWLDGTWSTSRARSPVSKRLCKVVEARGVRFTYVDYPAEFGPATGVDDLALAPSAIAGARNLADAVAASPYPAVVGGYSQGAIAAWRFMHHILPGRPDLDVRCCATIGDPYELTHAGGRSGIAGARRYRGAVPRRSVWAPGDPIADLAAGSPLRTIADLTAYMSIRSHADMVLWGNDLLGKIPSRLQRWWEPWRWPDLMAAGDQVRAYLGTAHTLDYINGGHVDRLAQQIASFA